MTETDGRTMGLVGATGVGVGAIVGGGILALAGTAFAVAGPAAILAFGANGIIAVITALSFAELSSRFPQSGGTYTFAKKVLSVEAAFIVGWVVWFASIVAAALYAIGFAAFAAPVLRLAWGAIGTVPAWAEGYGCVTGLACLAMVFYAVRLCRKNDGGGAFINVGKVVVFSVLIGGGLWALVGSEPGTVSRTLTPFLPSGAAGLFTAMGFTFIALQGFDLIAAVAGEVKNPSRTIPRAMLASLGIALVIYLPMLFVVASVGVPEGDTIQALSAANPDTVVAFAAENYLGGFGYWLVVVAAILSMLSALEANLFAASRVAGAMAADRTLPAALETVHRTRRTPVNAVLATTAIALVLPIVLPDVAAAGAAASLIFLVTFALVHAISILAQRRVKGEGDVFRTPLFPLFPILGGGICFALAVFQAINVPAAGRIAAIWLALGAVLFLTIFARRARVRDAASERSDPALLRLRGRSPLVLVPIGNPANAAAMVEVAHALATPGVGRVTMLNVVEAGEEDDLEPALAAAQAVLRSSLLASVSSGFAPEALATVSRDKWREIARVARVHECESLLLGLSDLDTMRGTSPVEGVINGVDCDTAVLRAPTGWRLVNARRILIPIGGRGNQDELRARLVSSLTREGEYDITYLRVLPEGSTEERKARVRRVVHRIALDETRGRAKVEVVESDDVMQAILDRAKETDLAILGIQRLGRRRKLFGESAPRIAREAACAIIMICRGR